MPSAGNSTLSGCVIATSAPRSTRGMRRLPYDLARRLVEADANQAWMAQLVVHRPFDEGHLHHDLRSHPMCPQTRQPLSCREGWRRDFEPIQARPQIEQQFGVEPGANLAREDQIVT